MAVADGSMGGVEAAKIDHTFPTSNHGPPAWLQNGLEVEFYSKSNDRWLPTTVIAVETEVPGTAQLSGKGHAKYEFIRQAGLVPAIAANAGGGKEEPEASCGAVAEQVTLQGIFPQIDDVSGGNVSMFQSTILYASCDPADVLSIWRLAFLDSSTIQNSP